MGDQRQLVQQLGNRFRAPAPTSPAVVECNQWLAEKINDHGVVELANAFQLFQLVKELESVVDELDKGDEALLVELRRHVAAFQRKERNASHILAARRPRDERRGKPLQPLRPQQPVGVRPARARERAGRPRAVGARRARAPSRLADKDPEPPLTALQRAQTLLGEARDVAALEGRRTYLAFLEILAASAAAEIARLSDWSEAP